MLDTSKPGGNYYLGWTDGLSGVDGTGPNSSDEITLYLANGASIDVTSNEEPSANIGVSSTTGLVVNDILMVCNRSEEHTSELQSLMRISYAVICSKKKKKKT